MHLAITARKLYAIGIEFWILRFTIEVPKQSFNLFVLCHFVCWQLWNYFEYIHYISLQKNTLSKSKSVASYAVVKELKIVTILHGLKQATLSRSRSGFAAFARDCYSPTVECVREERVQLTAETRGGGDVGTRGSYFLVTKSNFSVFPISATQHCHIKITSLWAKLRKKYSSISIF